MKKDLGFKVLINLNFVTIDIMKQSNSRGIIIFTDGSSLGNPGPGGYGAVVMFQNKDKVFEISGYENKTTNNRMEMMAIIETLNFIFSNSNFRNDDIVVFTDSSYVL